LPSAARGGLLLICVSHVGCCRIPVGVHRSSDVSVTHQLLLHTNRSSDRIQTAPIGMTEDVRADVPDFGLLGRISQAFPHEGIAQGLLPQLIWRREHPVLSSRELCDLSPALENLQKFVGAHHLSSGV